MDGDARENAPQITVAQTVLREVAPELAVAVHRFLHGGAGPDGRLPGLPRGAEGQNIPAASFKLRALHDDLEAATLRRRDKEHVAVLATAVRLQAIVLYETIRKHYAD